jgi:lipoate---protein ligase
LPQQVIFASRLVEGEAETSSWRLLNLEYADAPSNLALEEAIARQVGEGKSPPTLRLWRNRNAAIIGANQSAYSEVQLDDCKELGVEVVRRFTGGGAVYHDLGNMNYSICTRRSPSSSLGLQQAVFKRGLDCVAACLSTLGLESNRVPINTVVVRGRKISGGAGAIRWGAVLYHGSILVSTDLEIMWKILRWEQPPMIRALVRSTRFPVTSVERELGRVIPIDDVKAALSDAFARIFEAQLVPGLATDQELRMTTFLVREKYGTSEWNLKT